MVKGRQLPVKRKEIAPFVTKTIDPTSWKPETSWIIVLRREDGFRDVRSFRGTYREAAIRRDEYLRGSLYTSAWLVEEREKGRPIVKKVAP